MKIEDSFEVAAPLEQTWRLLNDIPAVIPCMPGAELVEVRGADEWLARLATKVGPMAMTFDTEVIRSPAAGEHSIDLAAKAREIKGRGRAEAKITSSLEQSGDGTMVSIVTDLQMQGPLAQFGRGVVAEISTQMTREFSQRLAQRLEGGDTADPASAGATGPAVADVKPVNGLRLFFTALWRWFLGLFRRGQH